MKMASLLNVERNDGRPTRCYWDKLSWQAKVDWVDEYIDWEEDEDKQRRYRMGGNGEIQLMTEDDYEHRECDICETDNCLRYCFLCLYDTSVSHLCCDNCAEEILQLNNKSYDWCCVMKIAGREHDDIPDASCEEEDRELNKKDCMADMEETTDVLFYEEMMKQYSKKYDESKKTLKNEIIEKVRKNCEKKGWDDKRFKMFEHDADRRRENLKRREKRMKKKELTEKKGQPSVKKNLSTKKANVESIGEEERKIMKRRQIFEYVVLPKIRKTMRTFKDEGELLDYKVKVMNEHNRPEETELICKEYTFYVEKLRPKPPTQVFEENEELSQMTPHNEVDSGEETSWPGEESDEEVSESEQEEEREEDDEEMFLNVVRQVYKRHRDEVEDWRKRLRKSEDSKMNLLDENKKLKMELEKVRENEKKYEETMREYASLEEKLREANNEVVKIKAMAEEKINTSEEIYRTEARKSTRLSALVQAKDARIRELEEALLSGAGQEAVGLDCSQLEKYEKLRDW